MAIPSSLLVFVDGHFAEDLSVARSPHKGIQCGPGGGLASDQSEFLQKYLAR